MGAKLPQSKSIKSFKESKLFEAWTVIQGKPSKFDPRLVEAFALEVDHYLSSRHRESVLNVPTFSVQNLDSDSLVTSFWNSQKRYQDYLLRSGFNYLGLHFLCDPQNGKRYEGYKKSIKAEFDSILNFNSKSSFGLKDCDQISFGYLNKFKFNLESFSLNDSFNYDFALMISESSINISNLEFQVTFNQGKPSVTSLKINVFPDPENLINNSNKLYVTIETITTENNLGFNATDLDKITDKIHELKETSKDTFMKFCKPTLIESMLPTYE